MKLYNELKLRFYSPIWGLHPELALFDVLLEKNHDFVKIVSKDVLSGLKVSPFGRKDSPTVEQILRSAIYKEIKGLTYRELEIECAKNPIKRLRLIGMLFSRWWGL